MSGLPDPEDPAWLDAQPFLASVAEQMAPGELLHAPSFSLFEAMSAIEIGDPRMDASLAALTSPTAGDLIDSGKVPAQLDDTTLLSILDKQMILEMTWQQGHSLAQTVFTCIYMLRPDRHVSLHVSLHALQCDWHVQAFTALLRLTHGMGTRFALRTLAM